MATLNLLMAIFGGIKDNAALISKRIISLGKSTKTRIGEQFNSLFVKLGFKNPKKREEKFEVLKKVEKEVKKEIQKLKEQEDNNEPDRGELVEMKNQIGLKKFRIKNKAGIKEISALSTGLFGYIKPMVKELVLKNVKTKLNVYVSIKIFKYRKNDEKIIKRHHLSHLAVSVPAENWFDKEYYKLFRELKRKFVRLITKESGWSLYSIEFTDIII